MRTKGYLKIIAVIAIALSVLSIFSSVAFAQLKLDTDQNRVKIDVFYHGSTISLSGATDPGADLAIKITSPEGESKLREKGRVGFFWMNTGELKFKHVPNLYFLYSTKDIEDILSPEEMSKHIIGYSSLREQVEITPVKRDGEKTKWFNEFVKFKEESGLYSVSPKSISVTKKGSEERYNIDIDWPFQAPPGHYTATVYEIKNKKIVDKAETSISVSQAGLVKTIANMASKNGALYGIVSIVIALVVGFGISLIFKKS